MRGQPPTTGPRTPEPESYPRLLLNLASVLVAVLVIAIVILGESKKGQLVATAVKEAARPVPTLVVAAPAEPPRPKVATLPKEPPAPAAKELDREAVSRGEAELDEATRDRARAEGRLVEARRSLAATSLEATRAAAASRKLAYRVRDPSSQLARLASQGGFVRAERDRLKDEVAALRRAPRPKPKTIVDRNPVAKPTDGDEYHFEVRRNRVAYIDLERLIKLVQADAQLRVRLADNQRGIESKVGPVGSFSMEYALRRASLGIDGLMERQRITFNLRNWELIPEYEGRGEPYEATLRQSSEYGRAINRLSPERSTVTMWVYPDGFPLFRKLRDDLHARGFVVAARPLPEGMPIRGSTAGSLSAGQ